MAVVTLIKKTAEELAKNPTVQKVVKRVISGAKDSPFKNVDDLGAFPVARDIKDLPGTEKKKLKEAGKKIAKEFRKQDKEKPLKDLQKGGTKMGTSFRSGGRVEYKSGNRVCKIAKRGFGRAYGKNS